MESSEGTIPSGREDYWSTNSYHGTVLESHQSFGGRKRKIPRFGGRKFFPFTPVYVTLGDTQMYMNAGFTLFSGFVTKRRSQL
jgi:hypothetical protein